MTAARESLTLVVICVVVIVLSLLGLIFDFTRLMAYGPNIDGILLLFVCLIMAGLFALMLFLFARAEGWLGKKDAAAPPAK